MGHPRFELKQSRDGQYYFNLTAANGEIIATSEMYRSRAAAEGGVASVRKNAPQAEMADCSRVM